MKKIALFFLVFLLAGSIFVASSCGNQTREANELIGKYNDVMERAAKDLNEVAKLANEIKMLPATQEGYNNGLKLSQQMRDRIESAREKLEEGLGILDEAEGLNISSEFKEYISMEIEADKKYKETLDVLGEFADEFIKFYQTYASGKKFSSEEIDKFRKRIEELTSKVNKAQQEAQKLDEKAKSYYEEKGLGK